MPSSVPSVSQAMFWMERIFKHLNVVPGGIYCVAGVTAWEKY
jgi:hypothetical protein